MDYLYMPPQQIQRKHNQESINTLMKDYEYIQNNLKR
jgi:hypothetical protein